MPKLNSGFYAVVAINNTRIFMHRVVQRKRPSTRGNQPMKSQVSGRWSWSTWVVHWGDAVSRWWLVTGSTPVVELWVLRNSYRSRARGRIVCRGSRLSTKQRGQT